MKDEIWLETLNLDKRKIKEISVTKINNVYNVYILQKPLLLECCHCKSKNIKKKGLRTKHINVGVVMKCKTIAHVTYHRYFCNECKKSLIEEPLLCEKWHRISDDACKAIFNETKDFNTVLKKVAYDNYVSKTQVTKIIDKLYVDEKIKLPETFSMDECCVGSEQKGLYEVIISDPINKKAIDGFQDRRQKSLDTYFSKIPDEERINVKNVSIDMWDPYRTAINKYFPTATIKVDPFHVFQNIIRVIKTRQLKVAKQLTNKLQKHIFKKFFKVILSSKTDKRFQTYYCKKYKINFTYDQLERMILNVDN